jgi:hypothetical protein
MEGRRELMDGEIFNKNRWISLPRAGLQCFFPKLFQNLPPLPLYSILSLWR